MMTLTRPAAQVYLPTGERDWDAEDAAHAAWVAGYERRVREQARWYGLTLARMDRLPRNRRTVSAIARDFARWVADLSKFDRDAADALKREVSDLMDRHDRDRDREPGAGVGHAPILSDSDPDAAFEAGYSVAAGGHPESPCPWGMDSYERRAWHLGVRAAVVDLDAEGGMR